MTSHGGPILEISLVSGYRIIKIAKISFYFICTLNVNRKCIENVVDCRNGNRVEALYYRVNVMASTLNVSNWFYTILTVYHFSLYFLYVRYRGFA